MLSFRGFYEITEGCMCLFIKKKFILMDHLALVEQKKTFQGCRLLGTAVQCKIFVLNIIPLSNANNNMLTVHTTYNYINLS